MALKFAKKKKPEPTAEEVAVFESKKLLAPHEEDQGYEEEKASAKGASLDGASFAALVEKKINQRGKLMQEEETLKVRLKEISAQKADLEETLRKHPDVVNLDLDETLDLDTEDYVAVIGKMGKSRQLEEGAKKKLANLLSPEDFFKLAQFKLGDLDDYLTAKQRETLLITLPTSRTITIKTKKASA